MLSTTLVPQLTASAALQTWFGGAAEGGGPGPLGGHATDRGLAEFRQKHRTWVAKFLEGSLQEDKKKMKKMMMMKKRREGVQNLLRN